MPFRKVLVLTLVLALDSFGVALADYGGVSTSSKYIDLGSGTSLQYCSNGTINTSASPNSTYTRAVVVIHGSSINPCSQADYILEAADLKAGVTMAETLIIAPKFYEGSSGRDRSDALYWTSNWRQGNTSTNGGGVSSFAAADEVLTRLNNNTKFPNLGPITIVGHSAGGQYVQRYAAGHHYTGSVSKYVTANPSSYLYWDTRRWSGSTLRNLTSSEISACSGYNTYKYGLTSLNNYMSGNTSQTKYQASNVIYLLGDADTGSDSDLDTGCEANWQGSQRFDRGTKYFDYLGVLGGYSNHSKAIVSGVGHDAHDMFTSSTGRNAIFD